MMQMGFNYVKHDVTPIQPPTKTSSKVYLIRWLVSVYNFLFLFGYSHVDKNIKYMVPLHLRYIFFLLTFFLV